MSNYTDQEIMSVIKQYMFQSDNPDLVGYRTQALNRDFQSEERFIWMMRYLCRLGNFQNKQLLDFGCGFGWQALSISLIGNNSIVGCDILPSMIDGMSECIEKLKNYNSEFDVKPILGDICNIDLPSNSFDGIYSIEAIEHVRDLDSMLDNCVKLLKPNGTILLVNDNNVLDHGLRKETMEMWEKRENSWEWANYLREIRPIEHGNVKPFRLMREEIILTAHPSINKSDLDWFLDKTQGLLKEEIEIAVKCGRNRAEIREVNEFDRCRNPLTGEYAERLLDPYQIADKMTKRGIKAQVYHAFRKVPLRFLNKVQLAPLNRLLFNIRPIFVVHGVTQ